jgi:hypothetical protein
MGMRWTVRNRHGCWDVDRPDGTWSATFIYWSDALRYANQRAAAWTAAANAICSLSHYERGKALEGLKQMQGVL